MRHGLCPGPRWGLPQTTLTCLPWRITCSLLPPPPMKMFWIRTWIELVITGCAVAQQNGDTSFLWEPSVTFWLFSCPTMEGQRGLPWPTLGQTPPPIFTQNGPDNVDLRKDLPLAVKIATFHIPWSPGSSKVKILQIFGLGNFSLDLAVNIRGREREHPLFFIGAQWNWHSVKAKCGWEIELCTKILHRSTHHVISRMRNDDSALCLWAHDVWGGISRKPLEIETMVQRTTNRKWPIQSPMVTSRDPERSRSWPQYVWCPLSQKWLEIATWWQWSVYRKWPPGNQMVT